MQTIRCYGCELPLTEEHFTPGIWTRGRGRCRPCQKTYSADNYAANRGLRLEAMNAYNLTKRFGMTVDDYDAMLAGQGGKCAICGATEGWYSPGAGRSKKLSVDHCHEGGQVRGLLCDLCNMGIGRFKHDPDLLRAAIGYLENSKLEPRS